MPARVISGTRIRDQILAELQEGVGELSARGVRPGLAAVLVGENPASKIYVSNKITACDQVGIYSETITPPREITTGELVEIVHDLNSRDDIDGILVQLPLPPQVDSGKVLQAVSPEKDVDGFHPVNVGALVTQQPGLAPCTPTGLIEILKRSNIPIAGRRAVVIGRSNIVGKPAALLLLHEHATVTICHSRTADLPAVAREADILIAAIGRPAMVTRDFIKPGATVLDVGTNRVTDAAEAERILTRLPNRLERFREKGFALVGDVHPAEVAEVAGAYTPVPGGVGP
ncbi:MAG: bifunctional 5,10-methylenetetrahydrofolate dehydrogenase/5,10-methenyltetrahydrofolate cyclohydrolase, partial [Chloroflexi bacterium]|nr:bifunctional 5,10-methylenetetrahydrofolate dehydrogenase/5,10-methenyltetrahydrofolate cyclohydrolase [Chloroflexota bacterium]